MNEHDKKIKRQRRNSFFLLCLIISSLIFLILFSKKKKKKEIFQKEIFQKEILPFGITKNDISHIPKVCNKLDNLENYVFGDQKYDNVLKIYKVCEPRDTIKQYGIYYINKS